MNLGNLGEGEMERVMEEERRSIALALGLPAGTPWSGIIGHWSFWDRAAEVSSRN